MTTAALRHESREGSLGPAAKEAALPFPFFDILDWFFSPAKPPRRKPWTARRLLGLAGRLAGSGRSALRSDWSAVLAESARHDTVRTAAGMVLAALRLRVLDLAEACWWPADRVLASRTLSNIVVMGPTVGVAWVFFHHAGGFGVVDNAEAIAVIGAALRGLVTLGRWWRDVAPPERKTRDRNL